MTSSPGFTRGVATVTAVVLWMAPAGGSQAPIPSGPPRADVVIAPASAPAIPALPAAGATAEIEDVIARYRQAFSARDAAAAKAVWPTVDQGRLARVFRQVSAQDLEFAECQTSAAGSAVRATVSCRGALRFTPAIGPAGEQVQLRRWDFVVVRWAGAWRLESVDSTEAVPAIPRHPDSPLTRPIDRPIR